MDVGVFGIWEFNDWDLLICWYYYSFVLFIKVDINMGNIICVWFYIFFSKNFFIVL